MDHPAHTRGIQCNISQLYIYMRKRRKKDAILRVVKCVPFIAFPSR